MSKTRNILITGAGGFIGKALVEQLRESKNYYKIRSYEIKELDDIFDSGFSQAVEGADIIVHLAADVSVPKSFRNPKDTFVTNVLGTARVLEACLQYKKKLIYPSSASVANADSSPYAHSKALAEDLVCQASEFIPTVILRLFNVYGEGMSSKTAPVMYRFLKERDITINGDGKQTRDFINVKDVVSIIEASFDDKWNGEIVEVGTGEATRINTIAHYFAKNRIKFIKHINEVKEVRHSAANIYNLKRLYKRKLKTNLEEDIRKLCAL